MSCASGAEFRNCRRRSSPTQRDDERRRAQHSESGNEGDVVAACLVTPLVHAGGVSPATGISGSNTELQKPVVDSS
jgi:hypothetical protein